MSTKQSSISEYINKSYSNNDTKLRFIDLFAGIGGFRIAFERVGCKCVFSSEIDEHACKMYQANFGNNPFCDITKLNPADVPDFEILCAGFPCQAFSICGKQEGFADKTRGTLFFDICRVLKEKKPKAFVLENVFNLEKHDQGKTLSTMLDTLNSLGYTVTYKVLNARNFGVPQNRERIIIIGNSENKVFDFDLLETNTVDSMTPFLDKSGDFEILSTNSYTLLPKDIIKKQDKSGLIFCGYRNKRIRKAGVRLGTEHLSRVHKQPNRIYDSAGIHPTLAAQESSGRYFIKVDNVVRKLTMSECYRFMGFPDDFLKIGSTVQLYARIGNSVCVDMIEAIADQIIKQFFKEKNMDNLEQIYKKSLNISDLSEIDSAVKQYVINIGLNCYKKKALYTVLTTLLYYKYLHPEQDIRLHQDKFKNGFSARGFDTKYVTPTLEKLGLPAMAESGWLTRSLEQPYPYDMKYNGAIGKLKKDFLSILDYVERNPAKAFDLLRLLLNTVDSVAKNNIVTITPLESPENLTIEKIVNALTEHFLTPYGTHNGAKLPVLAFHSIYSSLIKELKRYEGCTLAPLSSLTACDKTNKASGDIEIFKDGNIFESIEIKLDKKITAQILRVAKDKIYKWNPQRYYILSVYGIESSEKEEIDSIVENVSSEHGCQIIINGLIPTIKYYLRLIENLDDFIKNYSNAVAVDSELQKVHKQKWAELMEANGF